MRPDPDTGSSPSLISSDLLIGALAAACAVTLLSLIVWGVRDADRQAAARLLADTSRPQVLDVGAGWFSPTAEAEFAAYYPSRLRAHPGDTLRFTNPTIEDPHSVTFGLEADRRNQPLFATGTALPHIYGPCVSDVPISPSSSGCHDPVEGPLPPFRAQAYFNSGIVPPGGGVIEIRLADDLMPGIYDFVCVIHPQQVGTLEVVEPLTPTQRPRDLKEAAEDEIRQDREAFKELRRDVETATAAGRNEVQAGAAGPRASYNVFTPSMIKVSPGDTVTWTNHGPVPHVAVFGGYLPAPESVDTPPTRPSGSPLTEGLFTTGPIGSLPYPQTEFSVRFDSPGTYGYVCTLHPGMSGEVVVE